jgi:hypothetical protein
MVGSLDKSMVLMGSIKGSWLLYKGTSAVFGYYFRAYDVDSYVNLAHHFMFSKHRHTNGGQRDGGFLT